jgi:hypothetical protein
VYKSSAGASGVWTQMQKLLASDGAAYDNFGYAVSIYSDVIVVGTYHLNAKTTNSGILSLFIYNVMIYKSACLLTSPCISLVRVCVRVRHLG